MNIWKILKKVSVERKTNINRKRTFDAEEVTVTEISEWWKRIKRAWSAVSPPQNVYRQNQNQDKVLKSGVFLEYDKNLSKCKTGIKSYDGVAGKYTRKIFMSLTAYRKYQGIAGVPQYLFFSEDIYNSRQLSLHQR